MVHHDKEKGYYYYEYTEKKTRKHIKKVGFATRDEALEAEVERKKQSGLYGSIKVNKKLFEVIEEKLLDIKLHNPISTYSSFDSIYKLHIKPLMTNKAIKEYERIDIVNFMDLLQKKGRSNNTANKVKSFLVNVFNYAVVNKYILFNPINNLKNLPHEPKDTPIWTYEELIKALNAEDDYEFRIFVEFCYYCGIRKSERIITWKDVDFKKGVVSINKHLYENGNQKIILKGRKNKYKDPKKRYKPLIITLNKKLQEDLLAYKEYCKKIDGFSEDWYVFGGYEPIPRSTISNKLERLCKKAGVTRIHPHCLRHSMASIGYNNNLETQLIAARLGDTPEQVYQTYGHLKDDADRAVAEVFDSLDEQESINEKENPDNED